MVSKEKYVQIQQAINTKISNLDSYDTDTLTPPQEVHDLLDKSVEFQEWLIQLLQRSSSYTMGILEDEGVLVEDENKKSTYVADRVQSFLNHAINEDKFVNPIILDELMKQWAFDYELDKEK